MQLVRDELRNIGNRLTKCRQDLGLSQEEVAEELGVSRNTISSIENGGQEFSVIKLQRFSVCLVVKLNSSHSAKKGLICDFEYIW